MWNGIQISGSLSFRGRKSSWTFFDWIKGISVDFVPRLFAIQTHTQEHQHKSCNRTQKRPESEKWEMIRRSYLDRSLCAMPIVDANTHFSSSFSLAIQSFSSIFFFCMLSSLVWKSLIAFQNAAHKEKKPCEISPANWFRLFCTCMHHGFWHAFNFYGNKLNDHKRRCSFTTYNLSYVKDKRRWVQRVDFGWIAIVSYSNAWVFCFDLEEWIQVFPILEPHVALEFFFIYLTWILNLH